MFFNPTSKPLLWIFFGFTGGVVFELLTGNQFHSGRTSLIIGLIVAATLVTLFGINRFGLKILILLTASAVGAGHALTKCDLNKPDHISNHENQFKDWEAIVQTEPHKSFNRTRVVVDIQGSVRNGYVSPSSGKLVCYFDTLSLAFGPGTYIRFSGRVRRIRGPLHPGEFNKLSYYQHKNIYFECYSTVAHLSNSDPDPLSWIRQQAFIWKRSIVSTFRKRIRDEITFDIITALTCGYKQEIDENTRNTFSRSGVIHVLCVSGLHTGLVFVMFVTLLRILLFLRKPPRITWLFLLIPVWLYATMTGLSDSVVRASLMISFYNIGRFSKKDISPLNIVAASAMVIIAVSPHQVLSVGFQLSYLAVTGIIVISSCILRGPKSSGLIRKWITEPSVMSISAQITTTPMALYIFNLLPVYFLPANLIAIPATTALVYLSFIFLLLERVPIVSDLLIKLIEHMVAGLISSLKMIESMPGSHIEFDHIDWMIPILLYSAIIIVFFVRHKGPYTNLRWLLIAVILGINLIQIKKYNSSFDDSIFIVQKKGPAVLHYMNSKAILPERCLLLIDNDHSTDTLIVSTYSNNGQNFLNIGTEVAVDRLFQKGGEVMNSGKHMVNLQPYSSAQILFKGH